MINAFGNYIGFGNPRIYPLFKTTGSVDIYNVGNDTVFSFYNDSGSAIPNQGTGSITFSQNYRVEYLVVAGGGSGGVESGGGGGGGLLSGSFTAIANQPYDIRVGMGGQYFQPTGSAVPDFGYTGSVSYITGSTLPFQLLALGGGGGAGSMASIRDAAYAPAGSGGSGGGGGGNPQVQAPGNGSQGFPGGSGSLSTDNFFPAPATPRDYWIGGGGGGATSAGTSGSTFVSELLVYAKPGDGGSGSFSYIGSTTGSWYAGGGGADYVVAGSPGSNNFKFNNYTLYPTGSGGIGGGGNAYQDGQQRTGGGGGCSGNDYRSATPPAPPTTSYFGNGGSGIVILRVNLENPLPI